MNDFKNKVVYQIYTKSFYDSNGDGIGDINGITAKLDYLQMLGVDYLWISPFFSSPQNDNGYDVSDYYAVNPAMGTMEDVERLIGEAEKKDIGIMADMVFNHTSTEHEWFQKALAGDAEYMEYYIFRDGTPDHPPTNWESKFGGPSWEYVEHLQKWYLHLYDKTQADLNWENPKVREELKKIIRFWMGKGMKGFRFDVVNLISKPDVFCDDNIGDGRRFYTDGPRVHQYLKELSRDTGMSELMSVGEMSSTTVADCIGYSSPTEQELTMCFSFHHLKIDYKDQNKWELKAPDLTELNSIFREWQLGMQQGNAWNAVFWCNHDQPRIVSRLGDDQSYWQESAKMLATVIHLFRGTPYIYQGEELGMTNAYFEDISEYRDVESLNYYEIMLQNGKSRAEALEILGQRSRDNARTPMQWSDGEYKGFSSTEPWIPVPQQKGTVNAEDQMDNADSIFQYYQKLIRLRKENEVVADGAIEFMDQDSEKMLVYRRYLDAREILVINNWQGSEQTAVLDRDLGQYRYLLGNYAGSGIGGNKVILRPYETMVLELIR